MITANFVHRTFRIRVGDSLGTAFTVDVDGRQYLVTARHVLAGANPTEMGIFGNNQWQPCGVQLVGHAPGQIDISVLAPAVRLTPPNLPVTVSSDGMAYGQELRFLGFPYHFLGNVIFTDAGYPLPFAKRATVSCFDGNVYLLDGHNNPGFSGGPVVFSPVGGIVTNVAAVISGYKFVQEPVFQGQDETELSIKYNTGIIVSYKIENAVALIRANPIGLPI